MYCSSSFWPLEGSEHSWLNTLWSAPQSKHSFNNTSSQNETIKCPSSLLFLDFVPIDLDEWWAQRFLANIDKLSWHSSGICGSWRTVRRWDLKQDGSQRRGSPGRKCHGSKCDSNGWTVLGRWHRNHRQSHHLNTIHPSLDVQSTTDWTLEDDTLQLRFSHLTTPHKRDVALTLKCSKIVFSRSSVFASF